MCVRCLHRHSPDDPADPGSFPPQHAPPRQPVTHDQPPTGKHHPGHHQHPPAMRPDQSRPGSLCLLRLPHTPTASSRPPRQCTHLSMCRLAISARLHPDLRRGEIIRTSRFREGSVVYMTDLATPK
jgi:hypothetical protein